MSLNVSMMCRGSDPTDSEGSLGKQYSTVMLSFFVCDRSQDLSFYFIPVALPGQRSLLKMTKGIAKGGVELLVGSILG